MNRTSELNDNCFNLITSSLCELADAFEEELGTKPTVCELEDLIYWGIKSCNLNLFDDIDNLDVNKVEVKFGKKKRLSIKKGDVVSVPSDDTNKFHFIVYLGKYGHFGHAFGIIAGKHQFRKLSAVTEYSFHPCHKFTRIEYIKNSRWKVIENRPDFLTVFPETPEYYHSKFDHPENPKIGPYGSAEEPYVKGVDSKIRNLSKEESEILGVTVKPFIMVYLEDQFEEYLNTINE